MSNSEVVEHYKGFVIRYHFIDEDFFAVRENPKLELSGFLHVTAVRQEIDDLIKKGEIK